MNTSKSDGREHTNLATSRAAGDVSKKTAVIPAVAPGAERRGDSGAKLADADSGAPSARPSRRGFLMNSIVSTASLATATALTTVPALARELPAASIGDVSFPGLVAQFIRVRQRWAAQRGRDDEHAKKVDDAMFEATGMTSEEFCAIPYGDPRWEGVHAAFNKAWKEVSDPDPVDEHGASIEWNAILDQLWPVATAMIAQPPRSVADLAWQAEALMVSDDEFRDSTECPVGQMYKRLILNIQVLSGPLPAAAIPTGATETIVQPVNVAPSAMERAVARLQGAKAALAKVSYDAHGDDAVEAASAEEAEAERQVIRAPAKNLADVRLRALVMRQIIIDAEELGEPGDNRHHAALAALVADIFNDQLMDGEAQ